MKMNDKNEALARWMVPVVYKACGELYKPYDILVSFTPEDPSYRLMNVVIPSDISAYHTPIWAAWLNGLGAAFHYKELLAWTTDHPAVQYAPLDKTSVRADTEGSRYARYYPQTFRQAGKACGLIWIGDAPITEIMATL